MLKWKESAALIVGVALAAGAAAMPLPAEKGAVMTVTGEASVTLPNDEAQITVSKEVQDRDAKRASDEVVKAGNAAAEAMKAFGDAVKVETLALSTNPVYSRAKEGETPEIGAWRSVERMRVTVKDAKRVPEVLAALSRTMTYDGITFGVSKQARESAQDALFEKAMADAAAQAVKTAEIFGLGEKNVRVESIQSATPGAPGVRYYAAPALMNARMAAADAAPQVEAGEADVTLRVTMQVRITP